MRNMHKIHKYILYYIQYDDSGWFFTLHKCWMVIKKKNY